MNIPVIYDRYHSAEPVLSAYLQICDRLSEMEEATFFNLHYSSDVFEKAGLLVRATEPYIRCMNRMAILN